LRTQIFIRLDGFFKLNSFIKERLGINQALFLITILWPNLPKISKSFEEINTSDTDASVHQSLQDAQEVVYFLLVANDFPQA
jgi:hypothetical protein